MQLKRAEIMALAEAVEGIPLWGTIPGSPAALAGLQYGDILLSIRGRRVKTLKDYVEAFRSEEEGPADVVVLRGGEELTFQVERRRLAFGKFENMARIIAEGEYFAPADSEHDDSTN